MKPKLLFLIAFLASFVATQASAQVIIPLMVDTNGVVLSPTNWYNAITNLITGAAADATPDGAADYVLTYDDSSASFKKVLLSNLPGTVDLTNAAGTLRAIENPYSTNLTTSFIQLTNGWNYFQGTNVFAFTNAGYISNSFAGWYNVRLDASFSGTATDDFEFAIYTNGVNSKFEILETTGNTDVGAVSVGGNLYLPDNTEITVWVRDVAATATLTLEYAYLSLHVIGSSGGGGGGGGGITELTNLNDVDLSYPITDTHVLSWDNVSKVWTNKAGGVGGGEVNTASNQGGGAPLFAGKSGVDLEFSTLNGNQFVSNANYTVTMDLTNAASDVVVTDANGVVTNYTAVSVTELSYLDGVTSSLMGTNQLFPVIDGKQLADAQLDEWAGIGTNEVVFTNKGIAHFLDIATVVGDRVLLSDANGVITNSTVTASELTYLSGVTSSLMGTNELFPIIDGKQGASANLDGWSGIGTNEVIFTNKGVAYFLDIATITGDRVAGYDANGVLTNSITTMTELSYVNGVTSGLMGTNQLFPIIDSKQPADAELDLWAGINTNTVVFTNKGILYFPDLASAAGDRVVVTDVNGLLTNSTVTSTELGYVGGVTSGLMGTNQLFPVIDSKQVADAQLDEWSGIGTNEVVMTNKGVAYFLDIATITGDRVAGYDANGLLTNSVTTMTELSYVNGVTSGLMGTNELFPVIDSKLSSVALNDLTDVTTNQVGAVPDGSVLTWLTAAQRWTNQPPSGGVSELTNLNDVDLNYPITDGHVLKWDNVSKVWTNKIDETGAGGGDAISVNGSAVVDADFDNSTPAAPAGAINVTWQTSGSGPADISANIPYDTTQFEVSGGSLGVVANADLTNINHRSFLELPDLTADRVAVLNGSSQLTNSLTVDTTELGYLDGVTSSLMGTNQLFPIIDGKQLADADLDDWSVLSTNTILDLISARVVTNGFGNILWVDNEQGDDDTGTIGRRDLPFKTLGQAMSNAPNDSLVFVAPRVEYIKASFNTGGYAGVLNAPIEVDKKTNITVYAYGYTIDHTNTYGDIIAHREVANIKWHGLKITDSSLDGASAEHDQTSHTTDNWSTIRFNGTNQNIQFHELFLKNQLRQGISHLQQNVRTYDVLISNCRFENIGSTNIDGASAFDGCAVSGIGQNWTIENCTVTNALRAVEFQHDEAGKVFGNIKVVNNNFSGIWREAIINASQPYRDILIDGNLIRGSDIPPYAVHRGFIAISGTHNVKFVNNTVENFNSASDYMWIIDAGLTNVLIANNTFQDSLNGAISIYDGVGGDRNRGFRIVHNTFKNHGLRALQINANDSEFAYNTIIDAATNNYAVRVLDSNTNLFLHHNILTSLRGPLTLPTGFRLESATVDNVRLWENTFSSRYTSPYDQVTAGNNYIVDRAGYGITNISGTAVTFDWRGPRTARWLLSGISTLTSGNTPTASQWADPRYLIVANPSTHTITWPSTWRWGASGAPTLPSNSTNLIQMYWTGTEVVAANLSSTNSAAGAGSSDHGALTGLGDDDHPQYLLHANEVATNLTIVGAISVPWVTPPQGGASEGLIIGTNKNYFTNISANLSLTVTNLSETNEVYVEVSSSGTFDVNWNLASTAWIFNNDTEPTAKASGTTIYRIWRLPDGTTNAMSSEDAVSASVTGYLEDSEAIATNLTVVGQLSMPWVTPPQGAANQGLLIGTNRNYITNLSANITMLVTNLAETNVIELEVVNSGSFTVGFNLADSAWIFNGGDEPIAKTSGTTLYKIWRTPDGTTNAISTQDGIGALSISTNATPVAETTNLNFYGINNIEVTGSNTAGRVDIRIGGASLSTASSGITGNILTNGVNLAGQTNLSFNPGTGLVVAGSATANTNFITFSLADRYAYEYFNAAAFLTNTTSGASYGTVEEASAVAYDYLNFSDAVSDSAVIPWTPPEDWDFGTVKFKFHWSSTVASGDVVWEVSAVAVGNDDPLNATFGTVQTVTDSQTAASDLLLSAATASLTVGGTPTAGDVVYIRVRRLGGNGSDTLSGEARLNSLWLQYNRSATPPSAW